MTIPTLSRGSKGQEVLLLQKALMIYSKPTLSSKFPDGSFGPGTQTALIRFQSANGLATTGIYDKPTQDILAERINAKFIRLENIAPYAKLLKVEEPLLKAIYSVESKGSGFLPSGKPVILYEGHIFYRLYAQKHGTAKANSLASKYPTLIYPKWTSEHYIGGEAEHVRMERVAQIDRSIAYQSCSWGLFQIMGFNHRICGFPDIDLFVQGMRQSEHVQFAIAANFMLKSPTLLSAMRNKDWHGIARQFNGSGYAKHGYHTRLHNAYLQMK